MSKSKSDRKALHAWTEALPADWHVVALGRLLRSIEQGWSPQAENRPASGNEWGVLKLSAIDEGRFQEHENKALPDNLEPDERYEVQTGDLLVTRANTPELVGDACFVRDTRPRLMLSDLVYRLEPREQHLDKRFLCYFLLSCAGREQVEMTARGSSSSMVKISQQRIRSWPVPLPPHTLQVRIADFLNEKTARLDEILKSKRQQMEALEDYRTALIRHAVTRGFRAGRALTESRIPWVDTLPADWDAGRIRFVARLESGHTPSRNEPAYWVPEECTIPWFTLADVWQLRDERREYVTETAEQVSERGVANSGARVLPEGTVVLSRTASVGFSGIMARPMATSQDFANWICGPRVMPEYLLYVFRTMGPEFDRLKTGSTHQTIYMPNVRRLMMPLPPRNEQEEIIRELRSRLDPLDTAVRAINEQIEKLREYRTALISAAVTGKIGVHEPAEAVA